MKNMLPKIIASLLFVMCPVISFADSGWVINPNGGGGTFTGSISANQLAFGTGADTIGGSNNLTWDDANRFLQVNGKFEDSNTHSLNTTYTNVTSDLTINSTLSNAGQYDSVDVFATPDGSAGGVNYTGQINGVFINSFTSDARSVGTLRGIKQVSSNDGSTVTNLIGGDYQVDQSAGSSTFMAAGKFSTFVDGGTNTAAYGVYIPAIDGSVDPTTSTGLFIEDPLIGTTKWGLASAAAQNYFSGKLHVGGSSSSTVQLLVDGEAGSATGGLTALKVNAGAHLDNTNVEFNDFYFNATRTVNFAGGGADILLQRNFLVTPATYTADAPQAISIAPTFHIDGPPIVSTNMTISSQIGLLVGSIITSGYESPLAANLAAITPGIANGIGNVNTRVAIYVPAPGALTHLGNQTATLGILAGMISEGNTLVSDTNTRTVTTVANFYSRGVFAVGANVSVTNGPYAFYAESGANRFNGTLVVGGASVSSNAAIEVISTTKGFLTSRMTAAQALTMEGLLGASDGGLIYFDTNNSILKVWNGSTALAVAPQDLSTGASPTFAGLTVNNGFKATATTNRGTCVLNGAMTPTCTATVLAGAVCTANDTEGPVAMQAAVAATTLTITGAVTLSTHVIAYTCL